MLPTSTSFAWLSPELANAFCSDALQIDNTRDYGNFGVAHLGLGRDFSADFGIQDLFYLGETRSAEDLAVFTRMPHDLRKGRISDTLVNSDSNEHGPVDDVFPYHQNQPNVGTFAVHGSMGIENRHIPLLCYFTFPEGRHVF